MREIKFRAKRKDDGKWVYGYYFRAAHKDCVGNITTRHYILSDEVGIASCHTDISIFGTKEYVSDFVEVIPESVGQFTGLRDILVAEIYNGDVVQIGGLENDLVTLVFWDKGRYWYKGRVFNLACYIVEVIGNIHENPELLEK